MYCKHCNFKLEGELAKAKFCPICGAELVSDLGDDENVAEKKRAVCNLIAVLKLMSTFASDKLFVQDTNAEGSFDEREYDETDDEEYDGDEEYDDEETDDEESDEDEKEEAEFAEIEQGIENLEKSAYAMASIGENLFKDEYARDFEEYYVSDVRENCDARFAGIDRRTAPKIFKGIEACITDGAPYIDHLKEYESRIEKEVSQTRPAVEQAQKNFEKRKKIEWERSVIKERRLGRLRGGMLPVISFVGILLVALMCVAAGNNFKMFPYLDFSMICFAIALIVVSVTGAFAMSLYWRRVDKLRRAANNGKSTGLMKFSKAIRAIVIIAFIAMVVLIGVGAGELKSLFDEEILVLPKDIEILVAAGLTGFTLGAAVSLLGLSIFKAIGVSRSVGREKTTHKKGSSKVSMKKYGKISLIAVSVMVVILCVANLLAQLKITGIADNISYISFLFGDEAYITEVDLEYFEKNTEGYLPTAIDGKEITEIERGWIEENSTVKKLYVNANIDVAEGAFEPLRGLRSLTFAARQPLKYYFGGNIPSSLETVTVLGSSDTPLELTEEFFEGCEDVDTINFLDVTFSSVASNAFDQRTEWLSRAEERGGVLYLTLCSQEYALKAVSDAEEVTIDLTGTEIAKGVLNSLSGTKEVSLILNDSLDVYMTLSDKATIINSLGDKNALSVVKSLTVEEMYASYDFSAFTALRSVCIDNVSTAAGYFSFATSFGSSAAAIEEVRLGGGVFGPGCFNGLANVETVYVENVDFSGDLFTDLSLHRFIILVRGNNSSFQGTTGGAIIIFDADADSLENIDGNYYSLETGAANTAKLIYAETESGSFVLPDSVEYGETVYAVTEIAENALSGLSITELVLPNSLTSIERGALAGCDRLVSLTVPYLGATADEGKALGYLFGAESSTSQNNYVPQSLRSVTVNGGKIAEEAFKYCQNLTEVTIGENVTSISGDIFVASGVNTLNYNAVSANIQNYWTGNHLGNGETVLDVNFGEAVTTIPAADGNILFGLFQTCLVGDINVEDAALYETLISLGERLFGEREINGKTYTYKTPDENGCIHQFGNYWCFTVDGETKTYSLNEADYVPDEEVYCPDCGELIMVIAHRHEYEYTGTLVYESGVIKGECVCGTCDDIVYENIFQVSSNTKWIIADDAEMTSDIYHQSSTTATVKLVALKNVTFSFDYVVSSESGYDKFSASAPSYSSGSISGERTGSSGDITLSEGEIIEFKYTKDGSVNNGYDKVTITLVLGEENG